MNKACPATERVTQMTTFYHEAPQARTVCLIGEFNNWNPTSHPMRRLADGSWFVEVPLERGTHYYRFLVDGKSVLDPHAMYLQGGDHHENVSFMAVE